ncbi:hypothetical protein QE419_002902 [Brevundimonas vesicularis]|uniref:hypothetical protein n=1 Tax=Brevundimonas vesicularis TaxID=41276 RepID=UPI0027832868|nr:hypothetical protein [Brevundimonas vesicularis]MDQ1194136.1 hypothetical protein [Brevundimonas vesicularis]
MTDQKSPFEGVENLLEALLASFPGAVSPSYLDYIQVGDETALLSVQEIEQADRLLGTIHFMIEGGLLQGLVIESGAARLYDELRLTPRGFSELNNASGTLSETAYAALAKPALDFGPSSI